MKFQKLLAILLCGVLLSGVCPCAVMGIAEEVADVPDAVEISETRETQDIVSTEVPAEVSDEVPEIVEADIPNAEEAAEDNVSEVPDDVSPVEETETADETPAETEEISDYDVTEQSTGYALLTVNTYVYADASAESMIGRFAEREIVQLPDGDGDGMVAVRFAYDGTIFNAVINSADIMDAGAKPSAVDADGIPVVNEFEENEDEVQLTPDEWLELNTDIFFPRQTTYEKGMMRVDSMDLGIASKAWVKGGISPAYAYVDCDETVMLMKTPVEFNIEIGGFKPAKYVYSIYDQEFDAPDDYYYADVYKQTTKSNTITFTPEYAGRYFLVVCAYDAAGNYVYFESEIFETADASDASKSSKVYGKVKQIVKSLVTSSMDEYEIALVLHDWIVKNVSYAKTAPKEISASVYHAEGALLEGSAVCEGYTEAYRMLLTEAGVKSTVVTSQEGDHTWNLVRINGAWYHVDCTWDDPVGASSGSVSYEYFALTDAQLTAKDSSTHKWNETSTNNSMVPATSKTGIKINFSSSSELLKQLQKFEAEPQKIYACYTGKLTSSREADVRECASKAFKAWNISVSRNGSLYLITVKKNSATETSQEVPDAEEPEISLPGSISIGLGESAVLTLTCNSEAQKKSVVFSTSDANCVSVDSQTGEVKGLKQGSATVTATGSGNITAVCKVTVGAKAENISITQKKTEVSVGESFKLTTAVTGTAYNLKWKSSNSKIASVDKDGVIKALKTGSATISVQTYAGCSASCTVTVKAKPKAITTPEKLVLGIGQTYRLSPEFEPADAGGTATYTSSKTSVATISASGNITAKAKGKTVITVKDASGNAAKTTVTVKKAPTKVTLSQTTCELGVGETYQLKPSVPSGCAAGYIFKSSSSKVAVVDENGTVIPKKAGKATITVQTYNGKKATCKLTIQVAPKSVKMAKSSLSMNVGQSFKMKATVSKNASDKLTWSVSGNAVTVDKKGNITAKKVGKATVKAVTFNGLETECAVEVKAAPSSVKLSAAKLQISMKKTYVLKGQSYPDSTSGTLTYQSSNTDVASVNSAGKITAKQPGTAVITVSAYNGVKSKCAVTVVEKQGVLNAGGGSLDDEVTINDYPQALGSGSGEADRNGSGDILLSSDAPVLANRNRMAGIVIPVIIAVSLLTACAFMLVHTKRRKR